MTFGDVHELYRLGKNHNWVTMNRGDIEFLTHRSRDNPKFLDRKKELSVFVISLFRLFRPPL